MKRYIVALLTLLAALPAFIVMAQRQGPPSHVKWSARIDSVSATEGVLVVTADIESGWHIYGLELPSYPDTPMPDATSLSITPTPGLTTDGAVTASTNAKMHFDNVLKLNLNWFEGHVELRQPFSVDSGMAGVPVAGSVRYMACSDKACTPPASYDFALTFGAATVTATTPAAVAQAASRPAVDRPQSPRTTEWWQPVDVDEHSSARTASGDSPWWVIFGLGFLGGLLALLTPCVWPMIPMTVSFFLKKSRTRRRATADALTYALSIIVIYLVLGIAITLLFGAGKINDLATSAVFNLIFFALLVVFAISFFGAFDITLPSRWSNAVDSKAENTTGLISIFFMAFTLALVSFSCTGPIVGTLLVEAASQGSIIGPALGMGGFALGLALPFGLFAFFPSMLKEMPRSGSWLNTVKVTLAFVELILSLKFLSVADLAYGWHILDREVFLSLWIVLFTLLGLYLLGKLRFAHDDANPEGRTGVFRLFLAIASLSFAVYLVPGLWGAPLKSISAFAPPLSTQDFNLYGGTFREFHDYDEGMQYAAEHHKPVLVDFSGYACVNCRKMEGAVFDTPGVRRVLEDDYVLIKLMVDDKARLDEPYTVEEYGSTTRITTVGEQWSYLQRHKFDINSQPYYVILDNDGNPLAPARAYDEDVDAFVEWLTEANNKYTDK